METWKNFQLLNELENTGKKVKESEPEKWEEIKKRQTEKG